MWVGSWKAPPLEPLGSPGSPGSLEALRALRPDGADDQFQGVHDAAARRGAEDVGARQPDARRQRRGEGLGRAGGIAQGRKVEVVEGGLDGQGAGAEPLAVEGHRRQPRIHRGAKDPRRRDLGFEGARARNHRKGKTGQTDRAHRSSLKN